MSGFLHCLMVTLKKSPGKSFVTLLTLTLKLSTNVSQRKLLTTVFGYACKSQVLNQFKSDNHFFFSTSTLPLRSIEHLFFEIQKALGYLANSVNCSFSSSSVQVPDMTPCIGLVYSVHLAAKEAVQVRANFTADCRWAGGWLVNVQDQWSIFIRWETDKWDSVQQSSDIVIWLHVSLRRLGQCWPSLHISGGLMYIEKCEHANVVIYIYIYIYIYMQYINGYIYVSVYIYIYIYTHMCVHASVCSSA